MARNGFADMTASAGIDQRGFAHSALIYCSPQGYLDSVGPFVVDGLAMGEAVLVAVPGDKLTVLQDALFSCTEPPDDLQLADITEAGRNPSRFMAMQGSFVDDNPDRRVRIVSQLAWPGRSEAELVACVEHEALLNEAMDGYEVAGLCLYDASALDDDVLAAARATHPWLCDEGSLHPSPDYAPEDVLRRCNQPLFAKPGSLTYTVNGSEDLRPARSFVNDYAGWVGLSEDVIDDLQLIATELATNSLMYTDGGCRLAFWRDNEHVVCEARDNGRLDDALVGRLDPGPAGLASRGLYLVNAISDLVRTHTAATGTTIQAYLRLEP